MAPARGPTFAPKPIPIAHPAPPIHLATIPALRPAERFTLPNGLQVVAMSGVEAPVVRAEMIWDAGRPFEPGPQVSDLADDLLLEGTEADSAAEIESYFEQYGTSLDQPDVMDTCNLGLSTTHRWAGEVLPKMAEVIATAGFGEDGFRRCLRQRKQHLRENLSDNDTLAFRLITEATYGTRHPYGYNSYPDTYANLKLDTVRAFYKSHLHAGNATLFVVGNLNAGVMKIVRDSFGDLPGGPPAAAVDRPTLPHHPRTLQVIRPRAEQTMIRTGRAGIDIRDPDYPALVVLDTIYGGYFGSRLMRNIREDKGLTYGIQSEVDTYRFDGDFGVTADVANESLATVRREIAKESERLRQDLVGRPELEMVRAYLSGSVSINLDGVFGHAHRHRSAIIKRYDPHSFLQALSQTILDVTPRQIRDVAQKYLDPKKEWELILGGGERQPEAELIKDPKDKLNL